MITSDQLDQLNTLRYFAMIEGKVAQKAHKYYGESAVKVVIEEDPFGSMCIRTTAVLDKDGNKLAPLPAPRRMAMNNHLWDTTEQGTNGNNLICVWASEAYPGGWDVCAAEYNLVGGYRDLLESMEIKDPAMLSAGMKAQKGTS
jgi:hypothetical protein